MAAVPSDTEDSFQEGCKLCVSLLYEFGLQIHFRVEIYFSPQQRGAWKGRLIGPDAAESYGPCFFFYLRRIWLVIIHIKRQTA